MGTETPWEGIGSLRGLAAAFGPQLLPASGLACLAIRFSVGCALIIPMIIQTILLDPSGAVWTDSASNMSRRDPSGAVPVDAENPTRNRKVEGSNPSSGSISAGKGHQARRANLGGSGGGNLSTWTDVHRHCPVPSGKWSGRTVWCASRD